MDIWGSGWAVESVERVGTCRCGGDVLVRAWARTGMRGRWRRCEGGGWAMKVGVGAAWMGAGMRGQGYIEGGWQVNVDGWHGRGWASTVDGAVSG